MTQASPARRTAQPFRILSTVALAALLAGCQGLPLPGIGAEATRTAPDTTGGQLVGSDVEAPEVFAAEDRALWDGRPSLGGVWVAATEVRSPERIIIRNPENGKFVIGALFKKEHAGTGPALQLSSDAAGALGILAGQPTVISVVALREGEAAPVAIAAPPAPEVDAAPVIDTTAAAPSVTETTLDATDPIAAAVAQTDAIALPTSVATPTNTALTDEAALPDVATPTLEERVAAAVAATEAAEAAARETASALIAATPAAAPAQSTLDKPYIQVGIFSEEGNASNTAEAFRQAGIDPVVKQEESAGRTFWRVILGPATGSRERSATLRKARDLGFSDAYPVGS